MLLDLLSDALGSFTPELALLVEILIVGQQSHLVILFSDVVLFLSLAGDRLFLVGDPDGLNAETYSAARRPVIAEGFNLVEHLNDPGPVDLVVSVIEQSADLLLVELFIHEAQVWSNLFVEDHAPRACLEEHDMRLALNVLEFVDDHSLVVASVFSATLGVSPKLGIFFQPYACVDVDSVVRDSRENVINIHEVHTVALKPLAHVREVIHAQHYILRWCNDRAAACR